MIYNPYLMTSVLEQKEFTHIYNTLFVTEIKRIEIQTQLKRYILGMISGLLINPTLLPVIVSNITRIKSYSSNTESDSEDEEWDKYEYMEELSESLKLDVKEYLIETLTYINSKDNTYYKNMIDQLTHNEYDIFNKIVN